MQKITPLSTFSLSTILMTLCDILTDHLNPEGMSIFLAYNCKSQLSPDSERVISRQ